MSIKRLNVTEIEKAEYKKYEQISHNLESNAIEGQAVLPLPPPASPPVERRAPPLSGPNCMPLSPLLPARTLSDWHLADMAGLLYSTVERLPPGPTTSKGSVNEYGIVDGGLFLLCNCKDANHHRRTRLEARTTSTFGSCSHSPRRHRHHASTLSLA